MNVNITLTFMVYAYTTIIYCSINYYFILNTTHFFQTKYIFFDKKNIRINWLNQKILNVYIDIIKKVSISL